MRPQARLQATVTGTGIVKDGLRGHTFIEGERFDFFVGAGGSTVEAEVELGSDELGKTEWIKIGNLTLAAGHSFYEFATVGRIRINCSTFTADTVIDVRTTHTNRQ